MKSGIGPTYDANFNITGLVKEYQTFVERFVNTPFGDRLVLTGTFGTRTGTSYDWWQAHQGLRIDAESGTYYNRARQLHSGLGSFTTRDPLDYVDGMNLFAYVANNPVNWLDPAGTDRANDMVLKLRDLEARKDYDWSSAGGREGPNGRWLYKEVEKIKAEIARTPSVFAVYRVDIKPSEGISPAEAATGNCFGSHQFVAIADPKDWKKDEIIGYAVKNVNLKKGELVNGEETFTGNLDDYTLVYGPFPRNSTKVPGTTHDAIHAVNDEIAAAIKSHPMDEDYAYFPKYTCQEWARAALQAAGVAPGPSLWSLGTSANEHL